MDVPNYQICEPYRISVSCFSVCILCLIILCNCVCVIDSVNSTAGMRWRHANGVSFAPMLKSWLMKCCFYTYWVLSSFFFFFFFIGKSSIEKLTKGTSSWREKREDSNLVWRAQNTCWESWDVAQNRPGTSPNTLRPKPKNSCSSLLKTIQAPPYVTQLHHPTPKSSSHWPFALMKCSSNPPHAQDSLCLFLYSKNSKLHLNIESKLPRTQ